jgi:alpha-beta hydrolase superfamily lysophospholipase
LDLYLKHVQAIASNSGFFGAAPRLFGLANHSNICTDLPVYLFSEARILSGSNSKESKRVRRYRQAGLYDISHVFYHGGWHGMLNETNRGEVLANLLNWLCAQLTRRRA